jgi:phosphonate transport system substrate-binding protein
LVLGRVSNDPRKDYPSLKALADYLVAGLHDIGINEADVQFAEDSDRMSALLRNGTVDLVFDTVFPAIQYETEAGAKLLLREWRDGSPEYRSVLFKRRDNPLKSVAELVGHKVAFERRGSTTAYLVPRAELEATGLRTRELAGPDQEPALDEVGYVFAGSENNIVAWVHRGLVEAGAFSDIDWDQPEDMPPVLKRDLEIFHASAPLPRAAVIARHDLRSPVEQGVKRILLAAAADPTGSAVLKNYKNVTKYDEFVEEAAAGLVAARRLMTFGE